MTILHRSSAKQKITTKNKSFIALLLFATTFNGYSMEPEKPSRWAVIVGGVLLGAVAIKMLWQPQVVGEPFQFTALPKDMQDQIIQLLSLNTTASTLAEAAKTINSLAQVNKELNKQINDPEFCLKLIKHLAAKFNCSDQEAAAALQTKEAKNRLRVQMYLRDFCKRYLSMLAQYKKTFFEWYKVYDRFDEYGLKDQFNKGYVTDFEFTYLDPNNGTVTPLMICSSNLCEQNPDDTFVYVGVLQLIATGVDVNKANSKGMTALMLASTDRRMSAIFALLKIHIRAFIETLVNEKGVYFTNQNLDDIIKKLPTANIDQQDLLGDTALIHSLITRQHREREIIQHLLDAGADPELANFEGITPRQIAQELGDQEFINHIQNAIDKKHGRK